MIILGNQAPVDPMEYLYTLLGCVLEYHNKAFQWLNLVCSAHTEVSRITENRAWNQKIWALEAFRGKIIFLGGFGVIQEFLEWLEGLDAIYRGLAKFGYFCRFLECLG
jgi:hypothetical protein